jgi:drug/metabolite transporter (DMT)-like permease
VTLEPAFTAALAYFLFGERLNGVQIGGSLMILAGVVFLRIYEGWLASQPQNESPKKIEVATAE